MCSSSEEKSWQNVAAQQLRRHRTAAFLFDSVLLPERFSGILPPCTFGTHNGFVRFSRVSSASGFLHLAKFQRFHRSIQLTKSIIAYFIQSVNPFFALF